MLAKRGETPSATWRLQTGFACRSPKYVRIFIDGSHKSGIAAASCVVFAAWDATKVDMGKPAAFWADFCGDIFEANAECTLVLPCWQLVMSKGRFLGPNTVTHVELVGIEEACTIFEDMLSKCNSAAIDQA